MTKALIGAVGIKALEDALESMRGYPRPIIIHDNLDAFARCAARHMITNGKGAIVNLASIMGLSGGGLYPNISYQSTKGAVVNLTRALAVEWASHGIRVNAVAPTWVRTDFIKPLTDNPDLLSRMNAMTPLGRIAEIEEIVGGIVYLASPAASMVTGHTLVIDGGFLAQ